MSMWAVDNNISRKLTTFSTINPSKIAMIKSFFGGLVILGIALAAGKWGAIASISPDLWLVIVVMAVSGFGAALLFFLEGIKRIGTIKTMSVFSMVPIFGIAIAAITLGESISVSQAIATAFVVTGILIVSRR
jgi:drug/metabolite transporter (DMT)-like permease